MLSHRFLWHCDFCGNGKDCAFSNEQHLQLILVVASPSESAHTWSRVGEGPVNPAQLSLSWCEVAASILTSVSFLGLAVCWHFLVPWCCAKTNLLESSGSTTGETFHVVRSRIEARCIEPRRKSAASRIGSLLGQNFQTHPSNATIWRKDLHGRICLNFELQHSAEFVAKNWGRIWSRSKLKGVLTSWVGAVKDSWNTVVPGTGLNFDPNAGIQHSSLSLALKGKYCELQYKFECFPFRFCRTRQKENLDHQCVASQSVSCQCLVNIF